LGEIPAALRDGAEERRGVTYRILSLDGGGAWALIQAKALTAIFGDLNGHAVLSNFDMAVANSGGSIVLGGLLEDRRLSDILEYFLDEPSRRAIFQPTSDMLAGLLNMLFSFGPKFSAARKLPALQQRLPASGGKPMTEVAVGVKAAGGAKDVHILIAGFDYDRNIAAFFRSAPTGGPEWGEGAASPEVTLAQAIHASSNAPVNFFDAPAAWDAHGRYWDGAVAGCNNPILAAVAEAGTLGVDLRDVRALCVGAATVRSPGPPAEQPAPFYALRPQQSLKRDLAKLAGAITDDPPDVASFLAHVMTGGGAGLPAPAVSRIVRMNPMVSPAPDGAGGWRAPGDWTADQLKRLASVDLAALAEPDVQLIAAYADLWLAGQAPNQPLRMDADTLQSKLGPSTFQGALAAWRAVC
jgi:hypothetical protein